MMAVAYYPVLYRTVVLYRARRLGGVVVGEG